MHESKWVTVGKESERMVLAEEASFKVHLKQRVLIDLVTNFTRETKVQAFVLEQILSMAELEMTKHPTGSPADFGNVAADILNFTDRFMNLKTLPAAGDRATHLLAYFINKAIILQL